MNPTGLLLATFVLSLVGLFAFIWSLRRGLFAEEASGARTIFSSGEVGLPEEPAGDARQHRELQSLANAANSAMPRQVSAEELHAREAADRSSAFPAFVLIACAVVWLVVASAAGLLASVKLHMPDLLTDQAWLSFGRVRTLHLNAVAYGWAPLGLLGIAIWTLPDWRTWVAYEKAWTPSGAMAKWRASLIDLDARFRRTLMIDAPLAPLRTGRQPMVEDRQPLDQM